MIIKNIEVADFRGIKGPLKLDFPNGIIGIFGENESGKTTLMDSIFVGLYGLPVGKAKNEKDSKQYQITWGSKKAKIKIYFTVGNENYSIEREMTKTSHKCTLKLLEKSGKEDLISSSITEITNQMVELTGMDRSSFSKLVYIRQKDLDSLSDLQKTDREAMLNKVMGIDIFDKIVRSVKSDKKEVKYDLHSTNIKFETLEEHKSEKEEKDNDLKSAEQEVRKLQKELQKLNKELKDLKSRQKQLNWLKKESDIKQKIVKYKDIINQLEERIEELENNIKRRNEIEKDLKPLDKIEEEYELIRNLQEYVKDKNLDQKNLLKLQSEIKEYRDENTNFEEFKKENEEIFESLIKVEDQISVNKQEIKFQVGKRKETEKQYTQKEKEVNTALEELETLLDIQDRDQLKHTCELLNAKEPILKKRRTCSGVIAFTLLINIVLSIIINILVWIIISAPIFAISLAFSIFYIVKYYNLRKQKRYYSIYEKLDSEKEELENEISELSYKIEKEEKTILEIINSLGHNSEKELLKKKSDILENLNINFNFRSFESLNEKLSLNGELLETRTQEEMNLKKNLAILNESITEIYKVTGIINDVDKKLKETRKLVKKKNELEGELKPIISNIQKIESENCYDKKRNNKIKLDKEKTSLENHINKKPEIPEKLMYSEKEENNVKDKIEDISETKQEVSKQHASVVERSRLLKKRSDELKTLLAPYREVKAKKEGLEEEQTVLNQLEKDLKETSSILRSRVLPAARAKISNILPIITNQRYTLLNIGDDLKFTISNPLTGEENPRELFSGGTQDQFLISLRLAFTESIIDSRTTTDEFSLFMDECISSSDIARREQIFNVLRASKNVFKQIFIVSHEDISNNVDHYLQLGADSNSHTVVLSKSWS